tara:strand:+ start:3046 stop:3939 length:894 start_codon:yes stop_codon:yes gene_type:complete
MSDVTIFQNKSVAVDGSNELSDLAKSFLTTTSSNQSRRIQTNTNGTFKKIINGEQIGGAVRGEFRAVIIGALPKVSRIFYKSKFDPSKEATLPNCWSNLGDKPEELASDKQSGNCATCPQNIKGSGENDSRACKYQRRVSLLLENEFNGEVYQFNIPAKSLFGKGDKNVHPFESYIKYVISNNESPDRVVTKIAFDPDADTMELNFSAERILSEDEIQVVKAAQQRPETDRYTKITVAQTDGKKAPVSIEKPKVVRAEEPEDEVIQEPVKKEKRKAAAKPKAKDDLAEVLDAWGSDD